MLSRNTTRMDSGWWAWGSHAGPRSHSGFQNRVMNRIY
jgi:hypothetical protein